MRKMNNKAAKMVTNTLKRVLKVEANTNSCVFVYQPKAPKKLDKFKK